MTMRGWFGTVLVGGTAVVGLACTRGVRPGGPVTGGWLTLVAPDAAIAPGAIIASEDFETGDVRAICAPLEWLNPKEEGLPDPDLVGTLASGELREEFDAYVKAHGKGSKTPPLVDLRGRTIDRDQTSFGGMEVVGYHQNTLHPWHRNGVKDGCLTAITSQEDGSMHDGDKWSVAVVTRVLVVRTTAPADAGAPVDAGRPDGGVSPAPAAVEGALTSGLRRNRKGYFEGDGIVWAIQYQVLARAK